MPHTITNRCRFSFPVIAALVLALAIPLAAAAYETPTQDCKECVMKCVMGDQNTTGKALKLCLSRPWDTKAGDCNPTCPNVNRVTLAVELKKVALRKCETDLDACLKTAGSNDRKILLCRAEEASCKSNTIRFDLIN